MIFPRIRTYLQSLDAVLALKSLLVIVSHDEPIHGAATVRADLDAMRAAVTHIERETIVGMNAGKTIHALMRDVTLPAGSTTPKARPDCTTCYARQ